MAQEVIEGGGVHVGWYVASFRCSVFSFQLVGIGEGWCGMADSERRGGLEERTGGKPAWYAADDISSKPPGRVEWR